jgi:uncharacterized protein with HEPN domain
MPAKDPRFYLIHIHERCQRILDDTAGIEATWPDVPMVYDAVCRNLEIIGEAARKLDDEFRAAHPEIPWRQMIDTRNILIHAYYRVAPEILMDIVIKDIPQLQASVDRILGGMAN